MKLGSRLAIFCILVTPLGGRAVTVASETGQGPATFIESLTADGEIPTSQESENIWDWNLLASFTRSTTSETGAAVAAPAGASANPNASVVDETTDLGAGLNWTNADDIGIGAGLSWSTTPQEDLRTTGGTLEISKRFYFEGAGRGETLEESQDDDFAPWLRAKFALGTRNYLQTFGRTGRRVLRPVVGTNELKQNSATLAFRYGALDGLKIDLALTRFRYDRDIKEFQQYLDSGLALRRGFTSLSDTVGGLPESANTLGAELDFLERFHFDLSFTHSVLAISQAVSLTTRVLLACEFGRFTGSIGVEATNGGGTSEQMGLFGIAADF